MLAFFGQTDVGLRRPLNEDTIHARDGLFLVCDGMGGHKAGEVASKLATESIAGFIERSGADPEMTWPYGFDPRLSFDANRLNTAIKLANRLIFRKAATVEEYTGMGTTVVAVLVNPRRPYMTYANVGDSRIYLVREFDLVQLTRDDSWANLDWTVSAGEAPPEMSMKNILTKALGAREEVEFAVVEQGLQPADLVLLCSDGLTNMVPDPQIREILLARANDPETACRELVSSANAAGGRDNVSAIVLHYSP